MKFAVITHFRPGTALQTVIHAAIDRAPISRRTKRRIKNCQGCHRRSRGIDRAAQKLISLAL